MRHRGPWWVREFRDQGLRLTEPRQAVIQALENMPGHHTAEEIFFNVHKRYPGIGLATIYRTLDLLVRLGIVRRYNFWSGGTKYELIKKEEKHHHHLICKECGKVLDYDDFLKEERELVQKIEKVLSERHNFKIDSHNLVFYGICENCQGRR